jgi:hypothetical protein
MFDGGLFIVMVSLGVIFALMNRIHFKLIAVFIFFALGTVLLAGEDVGFTTEVTVSGGSNSTETFYIIGDGDASTFNENSQWVGWIFIAVGMLLSFSFLASYIGGRY